MKHILPLIISFAAVILTAATCDKENLRMYHDIYGNSVDIIGAWGLVEVQYETAGVVESKTVEPESLMEFREDGTVATLSILPDETRKEISIRYWEKGRGGITFLTKEEYYNHQQYDSSAEEYMPGTTYAFKVIDANTISYKESVGNGASNITNTFVRF